MPARFLLIDGYNLLYAAGMAQVDYAKGDLQRCRGRLLKFLVSKLTTAEVARATVVFDARDPPKDFPSHFTMSGLQVVFANPGGDADVAIENLIADHCSPKSLTLVSSDRRLQAAARRRRAQSIPSELFYDNLERRERRSTVTETPDPKTAGRMSDVQMQYWLDYFGKIPDVDELQRSTEKKRPPQKQVATEMMATNQKQVAPEMKAATGKRDTTEKKAATEMKRIPGRPTGEQQSDELKRLLMELEEEGF